MADEVRVQLMGPIRAWRNGETVELRGVSSRTVLACLALSPGATVPIETLCDALWGDSAPPNATGNVQATISRLRRGLGRASIVRVPGGYRLEDGILTDVAEIVSIIEQVSTGTTDHASTRLRELLATSSELPLDGVAPTIAFHSKREWLNELRLLARDRMHRLELDSGNAAASIPELRRNAEVAPRREQTQLLLAEALARVGRAPEALRVISRHRKLVRETSGLEPSAAAAAMERAILDQSFVAPAATGDQAWATSTRTRWIPPETEIVGRENDLRALAKASEEHRLITVTGPGGIGKSRLLMEFLKECEVPTVVVRLSSLAAGADVAPALAVELGLEPSPSELVWTIIERLRMTPVVLVLDNCEHVLDSVRMLVRELLRQVDGLVILTTSRRRLGLSEEKLHHLMPLAVTAEPGRRSPAVEVFIDRVSRTVPNPEKALSDPDAVVRICDHLAGIPLAIELAAPRVHLLGLSELQRQLESTRVPDSDHDAAMDTTVRWSLDLLGSEAQRLFDEICIFPAAFDVRALEAVSRLASPYESFGELVEASLISVEVEEGRQTFRVLEPIRQIGLKHLDEEIVEAYIGWVDDATASIEDSWLAGRPAEAFERLARARDDVEQAWSILTKRDRCEERERIARRIAIPLALRSDLSLVRSILEDEPTTPDGLMAHATLAWAVGRPLEALAQVDRLSEVVPDTDPLLPLSYWGSTPACSFAGDVERMIRQARLGVDHPAAPPVARAYFTGFLVLGELYNGHVDLARRLLDEHAWVIDSVDSAGFVSFVRAEVVSVTDPDAAFAILTAGLAEADRTGSFMFSRMIEIAMLTIQVRAGDHRRASELAQSIVRRLIESGLLAQAWMTLRHIASLLADGGEYDLAARVLDAAAVSPEAPELLGDGAAQERHLRRRLADLRGENTTQLEEGRRVPSAGELWQEVEDALARITQRG